MSNESGFSLVELLIALVVGSLIAASVTSLLLRGFRVFWEQSDRAMIDADRRQSAAIFQAEFRGLNTRDSIRPDIVNGLPNAIVYRPVRTLRFLCRRPDTVNATVTTWQPHWGLRDLRVDLDSLRLLVMTLTSEYWIGADLVDISPGKCPGGVPGVSLRVDGLTRRELAALLPGAPVLGGEIAELKSYVSGQGGWWLGMRRFQKVAGRWPAIQPVLGPLSPGGLEFSYLDENGRMVTKHTDVARIRVRINHQAADPSARRTDHESEVVVALRGRGSGL